MKKLHVCLALLVVFVLTAFLVGCPNKTDTETPEMSGVGATPPPVIDTGGGEDTGDDAADVPTSPEDVELTQEKLDMWIASMEDEGVKGTSQAIADEHKTDAGGPRDMGQVFEALAASAELDEAVKAHGFADAAEWSAVSRKVLAGVTARQVEQAKAEGGDPTEAGMLELEQLAASLGEVTEDEQKVVDDNMDAIEDTLAESEPGSDAEPTDTIE
jgi:hypothetical protein